MHPPSSDNSTVHRRQQPITSTTEGRLLLLDGEKGSVACRVHGSLLSNTFPRLSPEYTFEFATRSLLRMNNLIAVRGKPGASMVGPADYFGNIEKPHQYSYTIEMNQQNIPTFYQHPLDNQHDIHVPCIAIQDKDITSVKATWTSGIDKQSIDEKIVEYRSRDIQVFGDSLFENPGVLEIEGSSEIKLKQFDSLGVDLSSFQARLVANNTPFQITTVPLPSSDEYRAISYLYEPGYAQRQVDHGGGLFLEFHEFTQTITPLDDASEGFVTLAKWNEAHDHLNLIAVKIPYGCTLIIDGGCIHGDTNLSGMFMMCMTSNHVTMKTANTVFLKHASTHHNLTLSIDNEQNTRNNDQLPSTAHIAARPFVIYENSSEAEIETFRLATQNMNFIFNPFSLAYWKLSLFAMNDISIPMLIGCITAAIIFTIFSAITFGMGVCCIAGGAISATGIGFFAVKALDAQEPPLQHVI